MCKQLEKILSKRKISFSKWQWYNNLFIPKIILAADLSQTFTDDMPPHQKVSPFATKNGGSI